jgi:hypothetical protein
MFRGFAGRQAPRRWGLPRQRRSSTLGNPILLSNDFVVSDSIAVKFYIRVIFYCDTMLSESWKKCVSYKKNLFLLPTQ